MKLPWHVGAAITLLIALGSADAADSSTFDSLWQMANSKPDHRTIDDGQAIRVEIPSEQAIYFFTKPGHPEHPGVFKRSVVQEGTRIYVQTDGWSFGDASAKAAFEKILAQFKLQDAQMRQPSGSR